MFTSHNVEYLRCLLLKAFISLIIILLFACSSKEPRIPVKDLGFEPYMHKALNVDFKFDYHVTKYYITEMDHGGFEESFVIRVAYTDLERITNSVKSSINCQTVKVLSENPEEASDGTVSAYKCITNLINEQLIAYAILKEDINEIKVAIADLHLTGVF